MFQKNKKKRKKRNNNKEKEEINNTARVSYEVFLQLESIGRTDAHAHGQEYTYCPVSSMIESSRIPHLVRKCRRKISSYSYHPSVLTVVKIPYIVKLFFEGGKIQYRLLELSLY